MSLVEFKSDNDRKLAQARLGLFIKAAIHIALRHPLEDSPLENLADKALAKGFYQLAGDLLTNVGAEGDFPLNTIKTVEDAQLTLHWQWMHELGLRFQISDDQNKFPKMVELLNQLIYANRWNFVFWP